MQTQTQGMVRVERVGGSWWFVDADGAPFVSIGVNHLQPDCWLAPYNKDASLARYGGDLATGDNRFNTAGTALPRLVDDLVDRLRSWSFNTFGIHVEGVPARLYADRMYYAVCIHAVRLGSQFRFGTDVFPDVFSDGFARNLDDHVGKVCSEHRGNRNLIGYAFSDIPRWYFYKGELDARPERGVVHPWAADLRRLPAASAGKRRWIDILRRHHGTPSAAAAVHGAAFTTWDDAASLTDWPEPRDAAKAAADSTALIRAACERWYDLHASLIRKHDPGRLILGDKIHSPGIVPDWFLSILARTVDVVFIQWYTPFETQKETLERLHVLTGKPILNGDSSFSCPDPARQGSVKGFRVGSRAEAGRHYAEYLRGLMSLPFVVGWHHCGIMEQWNGAKGADAWCPLETGFMDPFEAPYAEIVSPLTAANQEAADIHRRAGKEKSGAGQ